MKRQRVFETLVVLLGALALLWTGTVTAAPPGNDDINSATAISSLPFSDALDTTEATTAPDDPFCGGNAATVWYSFTPAQNMVVSINTAGSDYGTSVSVYTGSPGALSQVTCTLTQATLNATASTTYYIMIGASNGYPPPPGTGGGNLVLSVTELVSPANDNFASATSVGALPFSDTVDVSGASTEVNEPQSCYFSPNTVWYSFTPSQAVAAQVDTNGSAFGDTLVNVYQANGPNITDLSFITCGTFGQSVTFSAQAGVTYYIQAGSIFGTGGNLTLNFTEISPPPNDDFANAVSIATLPSDNTVDTLGATREAGERTASCDFSPLGGTAWYAFTPATSGSVSASIFNTFFSTMVAAYTGNSLSSLTEVGCRNFGSVLTFQATAGTTYYFQVAGLFGQGGSLTFHLDVTPLPVASFFFFPGDPHIFESVTFCDSSFDPGQLGFQSIEWDFGDGATATGSNFGCVSHQYAADGDYTVTLTATTIDGRTASTSQTVSVKTHDVAITKVNAPRTAKAGQTRTITVNIKNNRYEETVQIQLFKSVVGGFQFISLQTVVIPVRSGNRTTAVNFTYTFTSDDATLGKVSFQAIANIVGARDALPADNTAISTPPTTVNP